MNAICKTHVISSLCQSAPFKLSIYTLNQSSLSIRELWLVPGKVGQESDKRNISNAANATVALFYFKNTN